MKQHLKVDDDWIYVLILLLTGLLIGFACLTLSSAREYAGTQEMIVRTQELVATARDAGMIIGDVEAESRNYVLKPTAEGLARLHASKNRLVPTLGELSRLTRGRPEQQQRVHEAVASINELLIACKSAQSDGSTFAHQHTLLDRARLMLAQVEAADNRVLAKRLHAQASAVDNIFVIMAVVAALVPVVVAFLLMIWHSSRKQRLKAEAELREQAVHLAKANRDLERLSLDLAEARDRAESASTLKSQFVANTSHEIRTPMNAIICLSSILTKSNMAPEQHEIIVRIHESAEALLTIINDILDFSKIEAGKLDLDPIPFNVKDCVERANQLFFEPCRAKHIDLVAEVDENVPDYVLADPTRVHQILVNLLANAVKFSTSGTVSVRVSATVNSGTARMQFQVADQGIGMTPKERDQLFKPFTQADGSVTRRFGGTGLGLSICKALVDLMHGSISVDSEKGVGSTFTFEIAVPVVDGAPTVRGSETADVQPLIVTNRDVEGLILVAEDNLNNQYVARLFLQELGFRSHFVNNGVEAIEAYKKSKFDMILMDCQMPVMDGLAATRAIRDLESSSESSDRIPIVALTASAMLQDREACIVAGMDDYMTKPLDERILLQMLRKWVRADLGAVPSWKDAASFAAQNPETGSIINFELLSSRYAAQAPVILNMFLVKTPPHIDSLSKAIEARDTVESTRLAHFLKGSSATICSEPLTALFTSLEAACRSQDWDRAHLEFAEVLDCCRRIENTAAAAYPKTAAPAEVSMGAHA